MIGFLSYAYGNACVSVMQLKKLLPNMVEDESYELKANIFADHLRQSFHCGLTDALYKLESCIVRERMHGESTVFLTDSLDAVHTCNRILSDLRDKRHYNFFEFN